MTRTRQNRIVRALGAAVVCGGLLAACSGGSGAAEAPEGYHLLEKNDLRVAIPEEWTEIPFSELEQYDFTETSWDTAYQDNPDFTDPGLRFVAGSQWGKDDPEAPRGDAAAVLERITTYDPFRNGAQPRPEPVQVRDGTTQVWRQDINVAEGGAKGEQYHLWAVADEESGATAVVGLAGTEVTPEMVETIDGTLDVADAG